MANNSLTPAESFYFEDDFMVDASVRARTRALHQEMKDKSTAETYKRTSGGKTEHYTELPSVPLEGLEAEVRNGKGTVSWRELAKAEDGNRLYKVNVAKNPDTESDAEYQVVNLEFPTVRTVVVTIEEGEPLKFKTRDHDVDKSKLVDPREISKMDLEELYKAQHDE